MRSKALLAGSSLVYQLCQRSQASCSKLPQVQTFIQTLEETLKEDCEGEQPTQRCTVGALYIMCCLKHGCFFVLHKQCLICIYFVARQLLYALKSVGNTGLSTPAFIPLLNHFMLGQSTALELRLAAIRAFRRFPCSADVSCF